MAATSRRSPRWRRRGRPGAPLPPTARKPPPPSSAPASRRTNCASRSPSSTRSTPRKARRRAGPARALLLNRERSLEALDAALDELAGERGGERALNAAHRQLERLRDKAAGRFDAALAALERAGVETREAIDAIEAQRRALERDAAGLERVEDRLHLLRTLARKHGVAVDALPARRAEIARRIAALDDGGERVKALERREQEARDAYVKAAGGVSRARQRAATALDKAVMRELPPLRLDKARFATVLTPLAEAEWGPHGAERVHFEVATNPGVPAGPLARIASGGELARFMLALKVVLARTSAVPTLVFDEVDSGIGGAVAAAVGERLHRLGRELQVLVVTHSPQVAARATHHWRVVKEQARAARARSGSTPSTTRRGARRSRACCRAPPSPPRRAPPPRA